MIRVVCRVLRHSGLRVSELTGLREAAAIVQIGAGNRPHVPINKLHDDRYLPLHPHLSSFKITNWEAAAARSYQPAFA